MARTAGYLGRLVDAPGQPGAGRERVRAPYRRAWGARAAAAERTPAPPPSARDARRNGVAPEARASDVGAPQARPAAPRPSPVPARPPAERETRRAGAPSARTPRPAGPPPPRAAARPGREPVPAPAPAAAPVPRNAERTVDAAPRPPVLPVPQRLPVRPAPVRAPAKPAPRPAPPPRAAGPLAASPPRRAREAAERRARPLPTRRATGPAVHIGTIEVHVAAPAAPAAGLPPPAAAPAAARPAPIPPQAPLGRPATIFGLAQG